jgi:DNA repair exonuclease SbcCD ATPase subunit
MNWNDYEYEKQIIAQTSKSSEEYDERIKELKKAKNMKQLNQVREHLKVYGKISSWTAITSYHITRLGAHILTLRKMGYDIRSDWKKENGKHWVDYILIAIPDKTGQIILVGNG